MKEIQRFSPFKFVICIITILTINSCRKNDQIAPSLKNLEIKDHKLLNAAKQYYTDHRNLSSPDDQKGERLIDYLMPKWDAAEFTVNAVGDKIIGIPLSSSAFEYNELNVLIKDGITYGVIKRYTDKTKSTKQLIIFSLTGKALATCTILSSGSNKGKFLDYKSLSVRNGNSPMFTIMEETVDGGDLENVTITPGGPPPPIIFPPAPVIINIPPGAAAVGSTVADEPDPSDGGWGESAGEISVLPRPTLTAFRAAFPNVLAPAVIELIGGAVKTDALANPNGYKNACALRVSRALNYSGVEIPEIPGKTLKGSDGKNYIIKVGVMFDFLKKAFGNPSTELNRPSQDASIYTLQRSKGIYVMQANYPSLFGATGHCSYIVPSTDVPSEETGYLAKGGVYKYSIWSFANE